MKRKFEMQWVGNGMGMKMLRLLYVGGTFSDRLEKSVTLIDWQWIDRT